MGGGAPPEVPVFAGRIEGRISENPPTVDFNENRRPRCVIATLPSTTLAEPEAVAGPHHSRRTTRGCGRGAHCAVNAPVNRGSERGNVIGGRPRDRVIDGTDDHSPVAPHQKSRGESNPVAVEMAIRRLATQALRELIGAASIATRRRAARAGIFKESTTTRRALWGRLFDERRLRRRWQRRHPRLRQPDVQCGADGLRNPESARSYAANEEPLEICELLVDVPGIQSSLGSHRPKRDPSVGPAARQRKNASINCRRRKARRSSAETPP